VWDDGRLESVRRTLAVDLDLVEHLDRQIAELELFLAARAKAHDLPNFYRLRSIPGVSKVLALTLLYEIGDVRRFEHVGQFFSYARLVRPAKESAGKRTRLANGKMGNAHLKWAFCEAAALMTRHVPAAKAFAARKEGTRQGQGAGDPGRQTRSRRVRDAAPRRPVR
jgi:transposase